MIDRLRLSQSTKILSISLSCAERAKLNRDVAISFLVAAALGAAIWALSFPITKAVEPWDADSPYYIVSLFVTGAAVGFLFPRHIVATFLGIAAGQLVYLLAFVPSGPLLPLGSLFLLGYSLLSVFGAALGSRVRQSPEDAGSNGGNGT